ncbi:MAG: hypothetical protein KDK50_06515, partial [Chlamydiia bacterium]|nr:hypothetical protein [Chlamydiia bacterium]
MTSFVQRATFNYVVPLFAPTWDQVESVLIYQLYGDDNTYCNTLSEIICMTGLISSVIFAVANFSLVYTGPSVLNACVVGSCLLGLYACRRVRRLIARQKDLESGIKERDKVAGQILPAAMDNERLAQGCLTALELQEKTMAEKITLISQKVQDLIANQQQGQTLSAEVTKLNQVIDEWIKIAAAVEASNQLILAKFKEAGQGSQKGNREADRCLGDVISKLRELKLQTSGDAQKRVSTVGLSLLDAKQGKADLSTSVKEAIEVLQNKVLTVVDGEVAVKCK